MATAARTEKIEIRVTLEDKQRITEAARSVNRSVSNFVLDAALQQIDETIGPVRIGLNAEQWTALMAALDSPPRELARVKELFSRPSVVETGLPD